MIAILLVASWAGAFWLGWDARDLRAKEDDLFARMDRAIEKLRPGRRPQGVNRRG